MTPDLDELRDRLREPRTQQWAIIGAMVVVIAVVAALVAPGFMPKPKPIPQSIDPKQVTAAAKTNGGITDVPKAVREAVLEAAQRDGISVADEKSVKVLWGQDKKHVLVYGLFSGKFASYPYVLAGDGWVRQ